MNHLNNVPPNSMIDPSVEVNHRDDTSLAEARQQYDTRYPQNQLLLNLVSTNPKLLKVAGLLMGGGVRKQHATRTCSEMEYQAVLAYAHREQMIRQLAHSMHNQNPRNRTSRNFVAVDGGG